ncbi:MAG: isocitrate/isopropylmalate family dehydrogenase, partial [Actinomycetes bacterium]
GKGVADPTAAILSTALLLDHLGYDGAATRVEAAVAADLAERGAATRGPREIGDAIRARL